MGVKIGHGTAGDKIYLCSMADISPHEAAWYALYSKPRAEKKLAERLQAKGFETYAPTQTVVKQWSDRKKKVSEVLFKSYVFVRFAMAEQVKVLETPGAVAIVRWLRKPAVIRDEEIQAIKDFLNQHADAQVAALDFKAGEAVRVKSGSLQDSHGTVVRQTRNKVVLQLEKLGMQLYAEVPKSQVEASLTKN